MTVYEVNLAVDAETADAYAAWLGPHIAEILALNGFLGATWFEVEGDETDGRVRWCVQYRLRDRAALQAYFDEHAARFRAEGLEKFGGRFEATRRVLALRASIDGGSQAGER
jgi:quinol monooxygenase YgiN